MVRIFFLCVAYLSVGAVSVSGAADPRFSDYPAVQEKVKNPARVRISDAWSRRYRSQLRSASQHPADFAGHYILATWGCGSSCVLAAAIDIKTGLVTRLPFTISNWPLSVTEPLEFKIDSRLLAIRGSRDEKGSGTHYYEFLGDKFKLLGAGEKAP
jgi:hypothetical protein